MSINNSPAPQVAAQRNRRLQQYMFDRHELCAADNATISLIQRLLGLNTITALRRRAYISQSRARAISIASQMHSIEAIFVRTQTNEPSAIGNCENYDLRGWSGA